MRKLLAFFGGRKYRDPQGPGVSRGRLFEIRAVLLMVLLILAGAGVWWGFWKMEKQVYLGRVNPERISTSAGTPSRP
ncbi:MAG: hypothetical protein EBT68_02285 [Verrucomicrobia bacterium]|nr:hypothetical protein [Verrucomicrobiota bacterium]